MTSPAGATVGDLLEQATRRLHDAGLPEARREAVALLALALGTDRGGVAARRPDPAETVPAARLDELLAARARRVPLQHLAGRTEFRGLLFEVSADVLIPRPETEDLVQAVLDSELPERLRAADLGTGSGCIAVSLAVARPLWSVTGVDLSREALAVAARNGARHAPGRIVWVEADFATPDPAWRAGFDAVVSNPPYVPEAEWVGLQPEVRDHEPRVALVPGPTGNEAYEAVARAGAAMLRPGGLLALELGWKSEAAVRAIVAAAGFVHTWVRSDLRGIPRVLTARKP